MSQAIETIQARIDATKPNPNVAKTQTDVVTYKQTVAIYGISRSIGQNADLLCNEVMKCEIRQLSRNAASRFIGLLKAY
jgi:hypothetical protein